MSKITKASVSKKVQSIDWSFKDADTQSLAHNIHRYSGKYIPQMAGSAIEIISEPGDLILDSYVGSGTTLVEANILGRRSVGVDLNPLAVLLTKVKVHPIGKKEADRLQEHFAQYIHTLEELDSDQQSLISDSQIDVEAILNRSEYYNDEWFIKWFPKDNLRKLILIYDQIKASKDPTSADIALVAFSNILRRCSNAHPGYPNVMFDKNRVNKNSVYKQFLKELSEICSRLVEQHQVWNEVKTKVVYGNAAALSFADNTFDAIVTHPPYIGSVPYAEYGLLSLKWLGYDPKEIDKELTGGGRQKSDVVARFRAGYLGMIKESFRVLKPGKCMFILIGHPTVKGELIDLGDMTLEFAKMAGFKLLVREYRTGSNRRANKMGHEDLIFLQKPAKD